jgi:hypothetical protein
MARLWARKPRNRGFDSDRLIEIYLMHCVEMSSPLSSDIYI